MAGDTPFSALDDAAARIAVDRSAPPETRLKACEELILAGSPAPAMPVLRELYPLPGLAVRVRRMAAIARYMERAPKEAVFAGEGRWETLDGSAPGKSTAEGGAMLWLREGAHKAIFVFSHVYGGFAGPMRGWSSMALLHRFLKQFAVNVVYLRDAKYCLHLAGIPGLGDDYTSCVTRLQALCAQRGWGETHALGVSTGGYSALRYGLDLGAQAVLSFSGPSDLTPHADPAKRAAQFRQLHKTVPGMAVDLLPLYRSSTRRPRLLLCFGEGNAYDARMAQRMAEFPETELVPFAFKGHTSFIEALRQRQVETLVGRLIGAAP
jgi:hypothetical protein